MRLRRTSGWALVRSVQVVEMNGGPEVRVQMERADTPRYSKIEKAGWSDSYFFDDVVQAAPPEFKDIVLEVQRRKELVVNEMPYSWRMKTQGGFILDQGESPEQASALVSAWNARNRIVTAVFAFDFAIETATRRALAVDAAVHATEPRPFCED